MSARDRFGSASGPAPWWWAIALIAALGAWFLLDAWATDARPLCGPP